MDVETVFRYTEKMSFYSLTDYYGDTTSDLRGHQFPVHV